MEKLVIALVLPSRKLMHYFNAYPIAVYTEFLHKNILIKADLSEQLSKWNVELGQPDIKFLPRTTVKGQVLVDFIIEFSPRIASPEQGCLASTHMKEESSVGKSVKTKLELEIFEVIKEPPQAA